LFTGIVETVGTIKASTPTAGGRRLTVDVGPMAQDCALGASVCVSGVCLTVAATASTSLSFDVVTETLRKSTLSEMHTGGKVNIERALPVDGRFDGHFVQGHVDGTARIDRVDNAPHEWTVWFEPESHLLSYLVPKGSVAIDGISLTIADVKNGQFSVALIPTTLQTTTATEWRAGRLVNIETDIIARTVVHHLSAFSQAGGLTIEQLQKAGLA